MALLPTGWRSMPLRFTVERPVAGDWGTEPAGDSADALCVRVADFDYTTGRVRPSVSTVRSIDPARRTARLLQAGDLLLEKSGGGEGQPVGRVVLVERDFERPAVSSNFIVRLRPRPDFDAGYLRYAHRALYARGLTRPAIKQTTGIQNLDVDRYLSQRVLFPPVEEQQRISTMLDHETLRVRKAVELESEILVRLPMRIRAVMHAALAPLDRNAKLGFAVSWLSGGTPPRDDPVGWAGPIPWVSTKDLHTDRLNDSKEHIDQEALERYSTLAPAHSVLVSTRGMSLAKRLPLAVIEQPMAFNQDVKALVPLSPLLGEYLRVALRAFEQEILSFVVDSAHGTRRLETLHLKSFKLPLPSQKEQRLKVDEVREIETDNSELAHRLVRHRELLEERLDSMISRALAGHLDPNALPLNVVTA